jgi:hypothetical protein
LAKAAGLKTAPIGSPERRVRVDGDRAFVDLPSGPGKLPVIALPDRLIDWIDGGRRAMYERIVGTEDGQAVDFFSQHLPAVLTYNYDSVFPFNCGNKGVGFLPKAECLDEFVGLYRETLEQTRGAPWRESLRSRLEAVSRFNFDRDAIDYRCLGSLEIFEKKTFHNLLQLPLAALLYTGTCPTYTSFQLNCVVEVIAPDDPRHGFLALSRTMFEYDGFHIAQPRFAYAYVFWISEAVEKTPHRVATPLSSEQSPAPGELVWQEEAAAALGAVPGIVRSHVREQIEAYARSRGFSTVTVALVQEARRAMRLPNDPAE